MIKTGLVSITFRSLSPAEIVNLVVKAQLSAIEWGGDIHVPHGDLDKAKQVRRLTVSNGLEIACYGSYFKLAQKDRELDFGTVLDTAVELQAPAVRVWAGDRASSLADSAYWEKLIEEAIEINDLAARAAVKIYLEFHANSITDSVEATIKLLKAVNSDNFRTLWQPRHNVSCEQNLAELLQLWPWLANLHVFHWWPDHQRHPLSSGFEQWSKYLGALADSDRQRYALLEFVKDDSPQQFLKDAQVLKKLVESS